MIESLPDMGTKMLKCKSRKMDVNFVQDARNIKDIFRSWVKSSSQWPTGVILAVAYRGDFAMGI